MIYTDTRDLSVKADFKTAVLNGMNEKTGGLYIPTTFPKLEKSYVDRQLVPNFRDVAFTMARYFVEGEIDDGNLQKIIQDSYPFAPKIAPVDQISYILELFHGPTCAFKDFGARFMARVMEFFNRNEDSPLHILVATSGDTGSAVGSAFLGIQGIDVTILYPKGKISPLQEKQLSTFTGNVHALKVSGTFDDCQKLVKKAFVDTELRKKFRLSSANSINIARLIPQSFYYAYAAMVVKNRSLADNKIENPSVIVCVPSGNFGNLTSGMIAQKMGAPIEGFVAATNENHTFPDWILSGKYVPRKSVETFANAMDVGAPSNFERIYTMFSHKKACNILASFWLDNEGILNAINDCYSKTGYIIDPHGAIAWKAWNEIRGGKLESFFNGESGDGEKPGLTKNIPLWAQKVFSKNAVAIILETAHPAKFGETVKKATAREPSMPDNLSKVLRLPDLSIPIKNDYNEFREYLTRSF